MGDQIVCRIRSAEQGSVLELTWSVGSSTFRPYALGGDLVEQFRQNVAEARDALFDLVSLYVAPKTGRDLPLIRECVRELAVAGHDLYNLVFTDATEPAGIARTVKGWLRGVTQEDGVQSLEVVCDGQPWFCPWNVLYDEDPDAKSFHREEPPDGRDVDLDALRPFWGLRYNLSGGLPVEPLRRKRLKNPPDVLLVFDTVVIDDLARLSAPGEAGATQEDRLLGFVESYKTKAQGRVATTRDELRRALKARPQVIYWLGHADPSHLTLGKDKVTLTDLGNFLRDAGPDDAQARPGGLVFLNACQTAGQPKGGLGSFLKTFHDAGYSGLIATEERTLDTLAHPVGIEVLGAFLDGCQPIGEVLQGLRKRYAPLGLIYGTYCPPDLRVRDEGNAPTPRAVAPATLGGARRAVLPGTTTADPDPLAVGSGSEGIPAPRLPDEPYLPLKAYGPEDRALFAGRDADVERVAWLLGHAETRVVVLHGESGVGKSSFLRAGLIPYLEETSVGYRFVRDHGDQGAVLFVRSTDDPAAEVAQSLFEFVRQPFRYAPPVGDPVEVDLRATLAGALGIVGEPAHSSILGALRDDPEALARLAAELPYTLVLVVDQAEEVFTLARAEGDGPARLERSLRMLARLGQCPGDFKVIVSLRTEFYGRMIAGLRRGSDATRAVRDDFLAELGRDDVIEFVSRPTLDHAIEHSSEIPRSRYRFLYEPGVVEAIADQVLRAGRRDGVLPLAQVVCGQLWERLEANDLGPSAGPRVVTADDLLSLGGFNGALARHVNDQVRAILPSRAPAGAWLTKIAQGLLPEKSWNHHAFRRLMTDLTLGQVDGSQTTALLAERDLRARYGHLAGLEFDALVDRALARRLLRVSVRRDDTGSEERSLSLGHDALTRVTAPWKQEIERRAERRRWRAVAGLAALAGVLCLACAGLWVAMVRGESDRQSQKAEAVDAALFAARVSEKGGDISKAINELEKAMAKLDRTDKHLRQRLVPQLEAYKATRSAAVRLAADVQPHMERGYQFLNSRRYDDAITEFTEVIRLDSSRSVAYNYRGNAWCGKKEYDKAIADYDTAIGIDPKMAGAYSSRGNAWSEKKEYDKAIADYDTAIGIDPKDAGAYSSRGIAWSEKKEYDKAIADYDTAIGIDPKMAGAYSNRGNAWSEKKEYDKAIADYDTAIGIDPKLALAYSNRGNARRIKGEYDKAIADYDTALGLDDQAGEAYQGIAWLRATCPDSKYRDGKAAVTSATRACEISGWKEATHLDILAAALAEAGDFDAAVKRQQEAIRLLTKDQENLRPEFEGRLDLYRAKMPYREPRPAEPVGDGGPKP